MKRACSVAFAALICAACFTLTSLAAFPERQIRLIVPFPPGGSTDVVARRIAPKVQQILGQPVVVENRGGAGGIIATELTAKAAPDGYTLLFTTTSHGANPALHEKLPYDTEKDFVSIALVADHPGLLVVHPSLPIHSTQDLVRYAKENPGKVSYSSAGIGTFPHLSTELLKSMAGISMVHIPYKGAGPAMVDLLSGQVPLKVDAYVTSIPHIKAGKLRAIAVTSKARIPQFPNVTTVAESGYPEYETFIWMGVIAPAGIADDVARKLEHAFVAAAKDAEISAKLNDDGVYARGWTGRELDALIRQEIVKWRQVVKDTGIKAE